MVAINLLPWRQQKQAYQDKLVQLSILISITFGLMVIAMTHIIFANKIAALRYDIKRMQLEEKKFSTLQRFVSHASQAATPIEIAENMQIYQVKTSNLLAEISKPRDTGVCFTEITRQKNVILFVGNARSTAELTEYLKNWHISDTLSEIRIDSLQQSSDVPFIKFRFRALESGPFLDEQGGAI